MVFRYLPHFEKSARRLFTEDDLCAIEIALLLRPEAGRLMPGCAGLRKLRWAAKGRGKSGGVRTIYYFARSEGLILLVFAYLKNAQSSLTSEQERIFRDVVLEELG